jgi:glycosyltransferase involved in cell wall biosynthesis
VARFVKRKNLDGLLRAYAEYRQSVLSGHTESPPWRMVILGDGDERTALQDLVRDQNIEGVTFPGFHQIEDLPIYYGLAGAFVHPASQEQWGLVVNEAMAAGLPVLVSEKCGCAPDLVCQGQNGFTFAPEDMSTLAGLMELMSSERVDLERMGRAAHNHVQSWGLDRFAHGLSGALGVALRNEV